MNRHFKGAYTLSLLLLLTINAPAQDIMNVSLPLPQLRVTSSFGKRVHPVTGYPDLHKGVDLAARCDPVLSIMNGMVSATGFNPILGNYIRIAHGEFQSIYGHLSYILVMPGEQVTAGEVVGITGATGRVTGEHLHFSIRFRDKYLNPLHFLRSLLLSEQPPPSINY
ncbi:peptidase M23-like protein [Arcticibacter tournemirensis]|uniref:M23 family metallopeptidase n=1 Tax=Arcticibacter tournemirensis TaxID=699437 RepID=A0A5M9GT76_9SPHI|nr:M23 family metallopeptidase [Arcticibacter tournemirensis]KAA8476837.1 M23 family metallopeptidase [Arcticibacter tournemirensis]TQM49594.1 peptidase M23-like protein [Arcticibacter tournemirensis]